jgi:NTP pyrophosphatase (non-canonical NTP hydrolase)
MNNDFSDNITNISFLKKEVKKFCDLRDWEKFHNPKDLSIGIITEASELLDLFRFKSLEETQKIIIKKKEEIKEELADILFFILRFAELNNIDLSKSLINKIEKNNKKYPVELVKGKNLKYNEY